MGAVGSLEQIIEKLEMKPHMKTKIQGFEKKGLVFKTLGFFSHVKPNERSCRILGNSRQNVAVGLQNGVTFFLLGPC